MLGLSLGMYLAGLGRGARRYPLTPRGKAAARSLGCSPSCEVAGTGMWTFLVRLECILCLSPAFSMMVQLDHTSVLRINQTHLDPSFLKIPKKGLATSGPNFTLEGFPFQIISGTMHYFRIPRMYWRDRLRKMKAGGFNTLTTHVPWNLHEPQKGMFHFTGNLDLVDFIAVAAQTGLWVILCPGPYIGSDLDLGGLPSWLLRDPKMKLRTTYKGFKSAMNSYFDELIPRIENLQYHRGGPIIAMQVENEYGSYNLDKKYMPYVKQALVRRKIQVLLITADKGTQLKKGHIKHVLSTVHMKDIKKETYNQLTSIQGFSPILMMVYTAKSFDTWGSLRNFEDLHIIMERVREMFNIRFSLNFYMFHGGTNFGFMGGAEYSKKYLPIVTSYDYGGLLTENGDYTPEYTVFREYFQSVIESLTPLPPQHIKTSSYKSVLFSHFMPLWSILPYMDKPVKSSKPLSMEQLPLNQNSGQSYGYILYETIISTEGTLTAKGHVQDRGQVFLNEKYSGILDHSNDQLRIFVHGYQKYSSLKILVENQGRLSSGRDMNKERKGLTGNIYLNNSPLKNFIIYSLEMKSTFVERKLPNMWKIIRDKFIGPAFYLGFLKIDGAPKDTFIKLESWNKGVVFINGKNLGRYWKLGPQETLYLPGPWLRPGTNEIILFEEVESGIDIQFTKEAHLGY